MITTKKGKGGLPIFCDNGEQVIPVYGLYVRTSFPIT